MKSSNKPGRKPGLTVEQVAAAIKDYHGNLAAVARRFGYSRLGIVKFIERHEKLGQLLEDARAEMLDHAESRLYKAVLDGEAWAICFFLKTQGRSRGYSDRPITDKTNGAVVEYIQRVITTTKANDSESNQKNTD
jgi:hypothetical protein